MMKRVKNHQHISNESDDAQIELSIKLHTLCIVIMCYHLKWIHVNKMRIF